MTGHSTLCLSYFRRGKDAGGQEKSAIVSMYFIVRKIVQ